MGVGRHIRWALGLLIAALAVSCAEGDQAVSVESSWNLSCPVDSGVGCGSLAPETCLGAGGQRSIVGTLGDPACDGEPIIASCESISRPDGTRVFFLEASVDSNPNTLLPDFAFELRGAALDADDGSMESSACSVTIIEDGLAYDVGTCGADPPSMEQPCQLSNITTENGEVAFDLRCRTLISSTSGNAFDVGAVGGGPTRMRFRNCQGF